MRDSNIQDHILSSYLCALKGEDFSPLGMPEPLLALTENWDKGDPEVNTILSL